MTRAPQYLGDGVFADCDEYGGITLTCEEGTATHEILLTPDTYKALCAYVESVPACQNGESHVTDDNLQEALYLCQAICPKCGNLLKFRLTDEWRTQIHQRVPVACKFLPPGWDDPNTCDWTGYMRLAWNPSVLREEVK